MIDKEAVKERAQGREIEVLQHVAGIPADLLDGRHHACPKCGGEDRFRLTFPDSGGVHCNQCFNEKNRDWLAAVQWMQECTFPQALRKSAAFLGIAETNGKAERPDIITQVCTAKRMPREALLQFGAEAAKRGKAEVVRVPAYSPDGEPHTHFDLVPDKKGWFAKGGGVGMFFPGRLPAPGETWHIVEGCKDAAALVGLGFLAAGLPTSSMRPEFAPLFAGCHVVLVPDLDEPSWEGAQKTGARLRQIATSVRVARLPGEVVASHGEDVRDVLKRSNGEELVRAAIENAKPWEPAKVEQDPRLPSLLETDGRTEQANAQRLAALHGDDIRFVGSWESFYIYNGAFWEKDILRRADAMAKVVAKGNWSQYRTVSEELDKEQRLPISQFCKSSSSALGISHMLQLVRSEPGIAIHHDQLDRNPYLLNLRNGTLDLKAGTLRSHQRADLLTCMAPVDYDPNATCPRWDSFMQEIMCGNQELLSYLQRAAGLSLSADVSEHVLFVCYGSGENGKSVFLNLLQALLGESYSAKAPKGLLMVRRSESHPTELAGLFGKRMVAAIEVDEGQRLSEALVKELTGGDPITARLMRQDFWQFNPSHKLWLAVNHKPVIRGTDHGIWRRIKMVPFQMKLEPEKKDKSLPEKLLQELPGILNWALRGFHDWLENGLQEPEEVYEAVSKYRNEQDVLGAFIDEWCVIHSNAACPAKQLYECYQKWAESGKERVLTQTAFGLALADRGFEKRKVGTYRYLGIGLIDNERTAF